MLEVTWPFSTMSPPPPAPSPPPLDGKADDTTAAPAAAAAAATRGAGRPGKQPSTTPSLPPASLDGNSSGISETMPQRPSQRTEFADRLVMPIGGDGVAGAVLSIEVWQVKDDAIAPTAAAAAAAAAAGDVPEEDGQTATSPYSNGPAGLLRVNRPQAGGGGGDGGGGSSADANADAAAKPRKRSKAGRVFGKLKKKIVKKFLRSKSKGMRNKAAKEGSMQQDASNATAGSAAAAAAAAAGMTLVGSTNIPLSAYIADQRVKVSVQLASSSSSNSGGGGGSATSGTTTVEMMLEPSAKRQRVSDAYRRCHGVLLDKIVRYDPDMYESAAAAVVEAATTPAAAASSNAAVRALPAVVTGLGSAMDAAVAFHADMTRLTPLQRAVDYFEAMMGAHAEEGVTCTRMCQAFEPIASALGATAAVDAADAATGTAGDTAAVAEPLVTDLEAILTTAEADSLIAAMETAVTSCLFRGARPIQCFPPGVLGTVEAAACIRLLRLAFACEPWQQATMGTMVDNSLPSIDTATVYESPLLMMAAGFIEQRGMTTYLVLKNILTERFGTALFVRYKEQVSDMLALAAASAAGDDDSKPAVMERLKQILSSAEADGEMLTYTRIKSVITNDYGASTFRSHRGDITAALVRQLSRRRGYGKRRRSADAGSPLSNSSSSSGGGGGGGGAANNVQGQQPGRRQLEVELKVLLERSAKESFDQLRIGLTPIDLLAGGEIISMSRTVTILSGNLALLQEYFQASYAQLPDLNLITMTTQHYDNLVATEVRELLFRWVPRLSQGGVGYGTNTTTTTTSSSSTTTTTATANSTSSDGSSQVQQPPLVAATSAADTVSSSASPSPSGAGAGAGAAAGAGGGASVGAAGQKQPTAGVLLNNIPAVMLRLYKAVRAFWDVATSSLDKETTDNLNLVEFQNWFFPFALDWINQSEFWAKQLIDNCMALDVWKPVSANNWFSSSVVDMFRVVYEILDVWEQIDWLDKVAREEVLMERLAEVLCSCVRHYIGRVSEKINPRFFEGTNLKKEVDAFYVDDDLCVALNNITEVRLNVEKLFDFLELERVAEAHIELVRADAERLSGGVLLEGNRMRLFSSDDEDDADGGGSGYIIGGIDSSTVGGGGGSGIGGGSDIGGGGSSGGGGGSSGGTGGVHSRLVRPHPALQAFDLTYTTIDAYRMHLMGGISRAIASRVTRDVLLIFQRAGPDVEGSYKAVEMLNRGLLREVDELKLPSKRKSGSVDGSGGGLFNSPSIKQTVRNRKGGKEQKASELREDGYLFVNLWIIGAKIGPRFSDDETRNATLKAVWEAVVTGLTDILCSFSVRGKGMQAFTAGSWRDLVTEALATFRLFFNSGGDGVDMGVLDTSTAQIMTPVLAQFGSESPALVAHFVSLASKVLDSVVFPQLGLKAPPSSVSRMQGDGALVHACDACSNFDDPLGSVKMRFLSFDSANTRRSNNPIGSTVDTTGSDIGGSLSSSSASGGGGIGGGGGGGGGGRGEVKSVRITVVGCSGINAAQNVYLSASLFAAETGVHRPIFKSKTVKEFEDGTINFEDEGFTVPDCTAEVAVQVRIHTTGGFLTWGETVLGEVLLDLGVASSVGNEKELTLPVQPLAYNGYAGRFQTLLSNRNDPAAKAFGKVYAADN